MLSRDDRGSGDALLLLHGIPGSRASWNAVVPLLPAGLRILVPDLLGFGGSPDGTRVPHAFEQADAVLQMLDDARVTSAHFAAFDFGGPVAVAAHALAPDRVRSLTLMATNLLADTRVPLPLRLASMRFAGELAFRMMYSTLGLKAMWRMATVNRTSFPFDALRSESDARGLRTTQRIFLASLRRLRDLYAPIEAALPRIDRPVTVLWGDRDPFFSPVAGERTAARIPRSDFVLLSCCGHFVPQERPLEVARAIVRTLGVCAAEPAPGGNACLHSAVRR